MNTFIYLDAAASSLKSINVIGTEMDFLKSRYANSGRGVCARSIAVDNMVDETRNKVAQFINASHKQVVFTGGTTDGLNRIVHILELSGAFSEKSQITVSDLDHYSARLPWEGVAGRDKCKIKVCRLDDEFNIDVNNIEKTDILIVTAMSNILGVPQPVKDIIESARAKNPDVITIVDAAQYVVHAPIDVVEWNCDFLCFSGHKIGADTGIGIMYIKEPMRWEVDVLGGGMVLGVTEKQTHLSGAISEWTLITDAARFEAGTLPLTQIAGLSVAIDEKAWDNNNTELIKYLYNELSTMDNITILTEPDAFILTFVINGVHPLDFGSLLGAHGICIRVGNMCTSWLHNRLGYASTIRMSPGVWNTLDEMKCVVTAIKKILE